LKDPGFDKANEKLDDSFHISDCLHAVSWFQFICKIYIFFTILIQSNLTVFWKFVDLESLSQKLDNFLAPNFFCYILYTYIV
jgi:hypothetical protein